MIALDFGKRERDMEPFGVGMRGPVLRDVRMFLRRLQRRALPDFLIIGAQKSGTSSLYRYLDQHPQVRGSVPKEVHYFDGGLEAGIDSYALGESWYRAHFPLCSEMAGKRAFEASPLYLLHPLAAERIAALLPHVKLVAILRDPTERALSHYFHNLRNNALRQFREDLPPLEAMAAEEARLAPVLAAHDYKSEAFRAYSYKARGRYLEQLQRYRDRFPRENLLVLRAEDLFEDPAGLMRRLADFLGLDHVRGPVDFAARNVGGNREPVEPASARCSTPISRRITARWPRRSARTSAGSGFAGRRDAREAAGIPLKPNGFVDHPRCPRMRGRPAAR